MKVNHDVKKQCPGIICAALSSFLLILFVGCAGRIAVKEVHRKVPSPSGRLPANEEEAKRQAFEVRETLPEDALRSEDGPDAVEEEFKMEMLIAKTGPVADEPIIDRQIPALKKEVREKIAIEELAGCVSTDCHTTVGKDVKFAHEPAAGNKCALCHKPGWEYRPENHSIYSFDIIGQTNLCLDCHGEVSGWLTGNLYLHYPVRAGRCTSCHKPHGSDFKYILFEYQTGVKDFIPVKQPDSGDSGFCLGCHRPEAFTEEDTDLTAFRERGGRNLHRLHLLGPKRKGCKGCHVAHASVQEKLIADDVPLGSGFWRLPIKYTRTETGGKCVVGCHRVREYGR